MMEKHDVDPIESYLLWISDSVAWANSRFASDTPPALPGPLELAEMVLALSKPIDMVLHCPACCAQHVDKPEPANGWANPPHRSHLCHTCGCVWRPADVPTNGVVSVKTKGSADTLGGKTTNLSGIVIKAMYDEIVNRPLNVMRWAMENFGFVSTHVDERAARLFEEATEVVQAARMPYALAQRILTRVYKRRPGNLRQEIGGLAITIDAFCGNLGISVQEEANKEFARIKALPKDWWQMKHAQKVRAGVADITPVTGEKP